MVGGPESREEVGGCGAQLQRVVDASLELVEGLVHQVDAAAAGSRCAAAVGRVERRRLRQPAGQLLDSLHQLTELREHAALTLQPRRASA